MGIENPKALERIYGEVQICSSATIEYLAKKGYSFVTTLHHIPSIAVGVRYLAFGEYLGQEAVFVLSRRTASSHNCDVYLKKEKDNERIDQGNENSK